jgi:hypothetical protein
MIKRLCLYPLDLALATRAEPARFTVVDDRSS